MPTRPSVSPAPVETSRGGLPSAIRGLLTAFPESGEALVDFPNNPSGSPVSAISAIVLEAQNVGHEVVLVFEDGDPSRPIILGILPAPAHEKQGLNVDLTADGKRVTVSADEEIVFRCGEASITLTRAGKVLIRGKYVLSRSSGANRIKGGSVEIN